MITYKTGNIIDAEEPIIVHGCNAKGVMGSGVAKAIRDVYPKAYLDYKTWEKDHGLKLGDAIWSQQNEHRWVVNAITQMNYGRTGEQFVSYSAIETAFKSILQSLSFYEKWNDCDKPIAIPRIGAGLGGGNWDIISEIIATSMYPINVVVYDLTTV